MNQRCALCEAPGFIILNGTALCPDHLDDGFALTMRGLAVEVGCDPDMAERVGGEMLDELRERADG
jgi:hypothetical protein